MRERRPARTAGAAAVGIIDVGILAFARNDDVVLKGSAAFGDWRQGKPGVRRLLTPQDLPAPRGNVSRR
jgi:hypothetical protein